MNIIIAPYCLDGETWRTVTEWEGYYEVSDFGRVRSVDRLIDKENGRGVQTIKLRGRIIRPHFDDGVAKVGLHRDGVLVKYKVKYLVEKEFSSLKRPLRERKTPRSPGRRLTKLQGLIIAQWGNGSARSVAKELGCRSSTVRRTWHKFIAPPVRPVRAETAGVSRDGLRS